MDVIDRSLYRSRREEIPVEPGPFLPKPKHGLAGTLANGQSSEKRTAGRFEVLANLGRHRLLRRCQKIAHVLLAAHAPHEQVDVLGHEDEGRESAIDRFARRVNAS